MQVSLLEYRSNSYCNKCFDERSSSQPVEGNTLNCIEFMGEIIPLDNIITPKDKARELIDKHNVFSETEQEAIQHAIISCNEILGYMGADRGYVFWTEVKQEINNINEI
jgi:hypothetical protein